jgi:hypothetical protein
MRTLRLLAIATLVGGVPACTDIFGSNEDAVNGERDGEYDNDDCKIEGSAIGQEGVVIRLGAKTVTVHDWVGKTGEANEYVGFSMSLTGGSTISYVVKASGELYPDTALTWMHPNGNDGSNTPGVSNVDYCEECEGGGCDGDPTPDPDCDNPDGCDGGDGGEDPPPPPPECDNPDGCPDPTDGSGPIL